MWFSRVGLPWQPSHKEDIVSGFGSRMLLEYFEFSGGGFLDFHEHEDRDYLFPDISFLNFRKVLKGLRGSLFLNFP